MMMHLIDVLQQVTVKKYGSCHGLAETIATKFSSYSRAEKACLNRFFKDTFGQSLNQLIKSHAKPTLTREISIIWSLEDVKEVRPDLTLKQAAYVLEQLKRNHDATIGINWEVIEVIADNEYPPKP